MTLDISGLNKHDKIYHQLTYDILTDPKLNFRDAVRVVVPTIGVFKKDVEYDLSDGSIPLSQTKPIAYKTQLFPEIVGFIRGETNLKWYLDQGMKIWSANMFNRYRSNLSYDNENTSWRDLEKDSSEFREALGKFEKLVKSGKEPDSGDLGNFYPHQWRRYTGVKLGEDGPKIVEFDQIQDNLQRLKTDFATRYAVTSAWNPVDVGFKQAALAPCHPLFQVYGYVDKEGEKRVDVSMYQRSCDHLLGVAFNAPQYSVMTHFFAAALDAKPGRFLHTLGDLHIYAGKEERAKWYRDSDNLSWLQNSIRERPPLDVLDDLLKELPIVNEDDGYDHIPFMLKQLGRKSVADVPVLEALCGDPDRIEVKDLVVSNYELKNRAPRLEINGVLPRLAS